MSPPIIEIKNLSKEYTIGERAHYGSLREEIMQTLTVPFKRFHNKKKQSSNNTVWALNDVSLEVKEGEVLGIIGRNGAGKSTLLKILSRITEPTKGEVRIRGRVGSLLEVGTGFHPELTGRENIFLNGALLGMRKEEIKKKFDEIVAFAEIERFIDTPVKRYSSGMYVRLAFAVAAHLEPEILLVDEVLAVGDAQFQKKCLGKLEKVGKEGRTILFVSHNLTAIRTLCNRAIVLKQGMLVAEEGVNEAISKYIGEMNESILSREWPVEESAPQNMSTILKKVAICDDNGKAINKIYSDMPFNIEVQYKVKLDRASVGLNLILYDNNSNCILASINNHEQNWYGKPMPGGHYRSVCKIPKNLLNNGYFSLRLILFGKNYTDAIAINEVLNIEIIDGSEVRGDYYGEYACRIRPLFHWVTNKEELKDV